VADGVVLVGSKGVAFVRVPRFLCGDGQNTRTDNWRVRNLECIEDGLAGLFDGRHGFENMAVLVLARKCEVCYESGEHSEDDQERLFEER
jgi:hypothetical protein